MVRLRHKGGEIVVRLVRLRHKDGYICDEVGEIVSYGWRDLWRRWGRLRHKGGQIV